MKDSIDNGDPTSIALASAMASGVSTPLNAIPAAANILVILDNFDMFPPSALSADPYW
jgi:hypothetical protein